MVRASLFQLIPGMLYNVHIWAVRWPIELLWKILAEPVLGVPGCVFLIIVLLQDNLVRAQTLILKGF